MVKPNSTWTPPPVITVTSTSYLFCLGCQQPPAYQVKVGKYPTHKVIPLCKSCLAEVQQLALDQLEYTEGTRPCDNAICTKGKDHTGECLVDLRTPSPPRPGGGPTSR